MAFKKKFLACMVALCAFIMLFSCKNEKQVSVETERKELFLLINPYNQCMNILDKTGKVIFRTTSPDDEYISIIKDAETDEPVLIELVHIGENKITEYYEADGEKYSYDTPSKRIELFDLEGKPLGFSKEGCGGIEFALNNAIFYNIDENKYRYSFDTKEETMLPKKSVNHFKSYVLISDYLWDEKVSIDNVTTQIFDKDMNLVKEIKGYSYDYISTIGDIDFMRFMTKNNVNDDKTYYNFLDEKLKFVFDKPIENNVYKEDSTQAICKRDGKKFLFDFATKKVIGKEEVDDTVEEVYDPDKYDREQKEIQEKFADIDKNAHWYDFIKHDKKYYYNSQDKDYNQNKSFVIVDEDKNIILKDIVNISPYNSDDYILCDFLDGTKIYDIDFKIVKDFGDKHIDLWSWISHKNPKGKIYYSYADENGMGILDENFNEIIKGLKKITMLDDEYFTYMDGFEYGFMDYTGKKLISLPIFDSLNDEKGIQYIDYNSSQDEVAKKDSKAYPRVDGSTANMPMMAAIRSAYLGEDLKESENHVEVTTTDYAWRNLLEGKNDLLLVYEPSSETKKIISESDVRLKVVPIGVDALVFINNEKNPVKDISTSNLINIYTGKIKNWMGVNGEDRQVVAFQRPLNSGSQTLFLNLLMKDEVPMDAPKTYRPQAMDDLIEALATYNNEAAAIGYSVYYYAKKMYKVPGLKLMSINGVEPSDTTITNGRYPFLNEYYVVIREDTKEDSETMKLFNFIQSDAGKEAIRKAGYIPR